MTKEIRIPKARNRRCRAVGPPLAFGFRHSFGFCHSSFVIRDASFVIRVSDFSHGFPVNVERASAKADEDDLLHRTVPLEESLDLGDGNSMEKVVLVCFGRSAFDI